MAARKFTKYRPNYFWSSSLWARSRWLDKKRLAKHTGSKSETHETFRDTSGSQTIGAHAPPVVDASRFARCRNAGRCVIHSDSNIWDGKHFRSISDLEKPKDLADRCVVMLVFGYHVRFVQDPFRRFGKLFDLVR